MAHRFARRCESPLDGTPAVRDMVDVIDAAARSYLFARYPDARAIQAYREHHKADIEVAGTVDSEPHFFYGRSTRAWHEEFSIVTQHGLRLDVVDNISLAPRIAVKPGDVVAVKGQLVPRAGEGIVHDTHHCPGRGWHQGGWIQWHGARYM